MKTLETVISILMFVTCIGLFVACRSYPQLPWVSGGSPGMYPQLLVIVFAVLGIVLLIDSRRTDPKLSLDIPRSSLRPLISIAITMFLSPWLLNWFGFKLGTIVFLIASMMLLTVKQLKDPRHWFRVVGLSAFITAVVFVVFEYGARVPLPVGRIFS